MLTEDSNLVLVPPAFGKPDHVEQVLAAEPGSILLQQLSHRWRDNLSTIFSPCFAKDISVDTVGGCGHCREASQSPVDLSVSHTVASCSPTFCTAYALIGKQDGAALRSQT